MELDERKLKILNAVIKSYLNTGEPVGSRTISKETDLNLSSATIRNEMADLEEMGTLSSHIHLREEFQLMQDIDYMLINLWKIRQMN